MSNIDLIIEERSRDIGDFLVGRILPFRKKRMVGPFIFIDHMGPTELGPEKYMDVDQHPHIGLATLTFLLEGAVMHEDSLGTKVKIQPGSVNWMVAGSGVTHTERTPQELRNGNIFTMHGYQIWVALPKEKEFMQPEFHHFDSNELPQWQEGSTQFKLVAGTAFGKTSPVPVFSDMFMVEIKTKEEYQLQINGQVRGEIGICIVEGSIQACDNHVEKGNMLVSKVEDACSLTIHPNSHIILFGGQPFEQERQIFWNFVASDASTIEKAKENWKNKTFPMVKNDDTYVPLPEGF
ncbi:MAG TPA: pirin family protein [Flavobacterium sp.]|uniref:pirin family protein n=1 Tax=unclassified Flavobacterium TaxID=196869 RepID=UPI000E8DF985|nr:MULTISPECIES: pirin family protein [unclassified Flavobacterium]HBI01658.1 hypothetical protein [Flavobacterium sp.]HRE78732.1 pirin family protein [Flavobacterium sp.]